MSILVLLLLFTRKGLARPGQAAAAALRWIHVFAHNGEFAVGWMASPLSNTLEWD